MSASQPINSISIQVCAAWPDRLVQQTLLLSAGACAEDVRDHPDLTQAVREAWGQASGIGVFGTPIAMDTPLNDGDRLELWRPLVADPKEARRERAKMKLAELKKARAAKRQMQRRRPGSL